MRIYFLLRKEFIQLVRDPLTLTMVFIFPAALLLLFGYAISLDVREVPLAIVDLNRSHDSRELAGKFTNSGYFIGRYEDLESATALLDRGKVKLVLVIPIDYAERVGQSRPVAVQFLVDGSNNNSATIALGYANVIIQQVGFDISLDPVIRSGLLREGQVPPVDLIPRLRFNPELDSTTFIVPGLVAMIMMMTVVVMSSLSIVRERELGTLETIMVSPISGLEVILGKLIPYFILGFADLFIILFAGYLFFNIPFRGSFALLIGLSALFIVGGLGMGLLISTVVQSQQVAWMVSLLTTMLPSIILSGFIFPIRCMPEWLQLVTYMLPVRYYLEIVRGIVLKGAGISSLWQETLALVIFATLMISLSTVRFRKQIG